MTEDELNLVKALLHADPNKRMGIEELVTHFVMTTYDELLYYDDSPQISKKMLENEMRTRAHKKKNTNLKELTCSTQIVNNLQSSKTYSNGSKGGKNLPNVNVNLFNASFEEDG